MSRLPPSLLASQRELVRRIERSESPDVRRNHIAKVAGVDASMPSKWTSDGEDGREISLDAARRLAGVWGWALVFGDDAREDGWEIARSATAIVSVPAEDLAREALRLTHAASEYQLALDAARADGRIDEEEGDDLQRQADQLHARTWRMCMRRVQAT